MTYRVSDETLAYNAKDSFIDLECANSFMKELDIPAAPGMNTFRDTYEHTLALCEPLKYMQSRGIKVDREKLAEEIEKAKERMEVLQLELNTLAGKDLNYNSPKQLVQYFYVEKGIPAYTKYNKKTQTSSVTCDDKALQRIAKGTSARKGLREASIIQDLRKLSKLKGTYLEMTFDADDRMRSSWNPRGTRFGRVSSSKTIFDTGGNAQNLHPEFLSFLVADPGCVFISLDKRQAEWVAMAYITGDENMINAVEQGLDVHAYTAMNMFRMPMDIIKMENDILGHHNDPDMIREERMKIPELASAIRDNVWLPRTMTMRQCGKKSNHGLNYDETAPMFALINEITNKEAEVIIDFYHSSYPGIRSYYDFAKNELQKNGRVLQNLFGRPQRFLGAWNKDLWKSAYSFRPQSTVGELVNRALVDIYNSPRPELSDGEILQQVHDSILLQFPISDPNLGAAILTCRKMLDPTLEYGGRSFVIQTDMKVGTDLGNMHELPILDNPDALAKSIREAISWQPEKQEIG